MKKLILSALAICTLSFANAQESNESGTTGGFAKSDLYLSGTVGFNSAKQGEAKSNDFTFSPSVGYFLTDNIALEAGLMVGSGEDASETKTSSFGAELGARYFFTPASQFSFTLGAGFAYASTTETPNGGEDFKVNGFGFAVSPGVNYFVSNNFALRASVGALSYASAKADVDGAEAADQFGLNLDLSDINFGLTYKF